MIEELRALATAEHKLLMDKIAFLENNLFKEDIPLGVALTNIPLVPDYKQLVALNIRGKIVLINWLFTTAPSLESALPLLSTQTQESIVAVSGKLGIKFNQILEAALLTKTLSEKSANGAIAIELYGGPEALRLTEATFPESSVNTTLTPLRKGYRLECYTDPKISYADIPSRLLLADIKHPDASFQQLFPAVLLFSSHVANKRALQNEANISAETE